MHFIWLWNNIDVFAFFGNFLTFKFFNNPDTKNTLFDYFCYIEIYLAYRIYCMYDLPSSTHVVVIPFCMCI